MKVLSIVLIGLAACGLLEARKLPAQSTDGVNFCQGCRQMVTFVNHFNNASQRTELKEVFEGFCENYYPVSTDYQQGSCPLFVETLFYIIDNTDPIHHCDQIGACRANEMATLEVIPTKTGVSSRTNDIECSVCEATVKHVKEIATNPENQQQIIKTVDSFCEWLKVVNAQKECKTWFYDNMLKALKFINQLDPRKYCHSINACPAYERIAPLPRASPTLPTLADFNNFGIETSVRVNGVITKSIEKADFGLTIHQVANLHTPTCQLCKSVVIYVTKFLRDNSTEESIQNVLDKACDVIYKNPDSRDQCEGMVKAYTKEIIQLLIDETDPQIICTLLDQCVYKPKPKQISSGKQQQQQQKPDTTKLASPKIARSIDFGSFLNSLRPSQVGSSLKSCFECKLIIKFLRENLNDTKTQKGVDVWLENNICQTITDASERQRCNQMIDQYSAAFYKAVVEELNPADVCIELGACHKRLLGQVLTIDNSPTSPVGVGSSNRREDKPTTTTTTIRSQNTPICEQCVEIITQIDDYLAEHPIDQDISIIIEDVCNNLPSAQMQSSCTILVKTMGSHLAEAISRMESPQALCTEFMLCAA